jgi:hypothetical protein
MPTKKYKYVTCTKLGDDLFLAEYAPNLSVDLAVAKEIVSNRLEFTNEQDHYVVIDLSNIKDVTAEAKQYLQHPEGGLQKIKAAAFFATNPVAILLANVYVKTPVTFEAKFFDLKDKALEWIRECMRQDKTVI